MAIVSNPAAVWTLISTIQLITYMPINGNPLTPTIIAFCSSIGGFNLIPNAMKYIFDSNCSGQPYSNAQTIGISTSVFWINIGPSASILLGLIAVLPFVYMISKIKLGKIAIKFARLLANYRYSVFLRFWIQAYLDVGFYSLIQLKAEIYSPVSGNINLLSAVIGIVFSKQIFTLLTPPGVFLCSFISKERVFNASDSQYHKRFGSFFAEFKNNKGFLSSQYYTLYFIRRVTYLLVQVYLNSYPHLQAGLNSSFTIVAIAYLIYFRPFKDSHILVSYFASEICVLIVFSSSISFLYGISYKKTLIIEDLIIFSVLSAMFVQFLVSVYSFGKSLKDIWHKIEKLRAKFLIEKSRSSVLSLNK